MEGNMSFSMLAGNFGNQVDGCVGVAVSKHQISPPIKMVADKCRFMLISKD